MPTFAYKTLATNGRGLPATIDAPDRAAAVRELMRRGQTPTSLEQVAENGRGNGAAVMAASASAGGVSSGASVGRVMSLGEMANLIRELATALAAGLPLGGSAERRVG